MHEGGKREKGKSGYDTIVIYLRQNKADFRDCFGSEHGTGGRGGYFGESYFFFGSFGEFLSN